MKYLVLIIIAASYKFVATSPTNIATGHDLVKALEYGNEAEAIRLLDNGAHANIPSDSGRLPMFYAALHGFEKVVKRLIENGYEHQIHHRSNDPKYGLTIPLIAAAGNNHKNVVKLLIKNGAVVNAAEEVKESNEYATYTAIQDAAMSGHEEIVKLLLENGADPHVKNNLGTSALDIAFRDGRCNIVHLFGGDFKRCASNRLAHEELIELTLALLGATKIPT